MQILKKLKQSIGLDSEKRFEQQQTRKNELIDNILELINSKEKPASKDKMYAGGCGWTRENDKDTPRAHKWKLDCGGSWSEKYYPAKEGKIVINCENCNDTRQPLVPSKFKKKYEKLFPIEQTD